MLIIAMYYTFLFSLFAHFQFIPRLIEKLESPISRGLFGSLQAGSCILARHQNRLVLLRVIEAGYLFRCVEAKGLELQETSCHSLEAATVSSSTFFFIFLSLTSVTIVVTTIRMLRTGCGTAKLG